MDITQYPHLEYTGTYDAAHRRRVNKVKMPLNRIKFSGAGIAEFNEILGWLRNEVDTCPQDWTELIRTPSGGVSIAQPNLIPPAYSIVTGTASIELIIVCEVGMYRFLISNQEHAEVTIHGRQAFEEYRKRLLDHGIDLNNYAIDNGKEVKTTIEKPRIWLNPKYERPTPDSEGYWAHHLDINSAYQAGIAGAFPEFRPTIEDIYEHRKDPGKDKINKAILNMTQGFMQSQFCVMGGHGYALAHIAKAGIDFCAHYIDALCATLESEGFDVIATNTDGIWYVDPTDPTRLFEHKGLEGTGLGQFKHDVPLCRLRYKSRGAYEYLLHDGTYKPVVRGETNLDAEKPRDEWQWGDIYNSEPKKYRFNNITWRIETYETQNGS